MSEREGQGIYVSQRERGGGRVRGRERGIYTSEGERGWECVHHVTKLVVTRISQL